MNMFIVKNSIYCQVESNLVPQLSLCILASIPLAVYAYGLCM